MIYSFSEVVTIKSEIDALRQKINYHNNLYYNQDAPEITDYEYDKLMKRLRELEELHPEFLDPNSPTQHVGGTPNTLFSPVTHKIVMQSLNDVFSKEDVTDFINKVHKKAETTDVEFVVEPKIDGLSVSLEYKNGIFVRGSTRGNGEVGENVTANLHTINDIPKKLSEPVDFLEVRGEVYMSHDSFAKLNEVENFANPRNAAAGSLRNKDSSITASRELSFIAFNIQFCKGVNLDSHSECLEYLSKQGLNIPPNILISSNPNEILSHFDKIEEFKNKFGFDTDGAVVKVNDLALRESLGTTSKAPRWAVAYKYKPEEAHAKLKEINLQIGRTGVLTPNAVFEEVQLSGTRVSRATLHNFDFIAKKDIRIGDTIVIQKAGEIIPAVVRVLENKRNGSEKPFKIPSKCPYCKGKVEQEDEVAYRCINSECIGQKERAIIHFASKNAMNIDGLGETFLKKLVRTNTVNKPSDLYALSLKTIESLQDNPKYEEQVTFDGTYIIASKTAFNLENSIEQSKKAGLVRLLFALGIRNLGQTTAKDIAEKFGSIDAIIKASEVELTSIRGIKGAVYNAICEYFSDKNNIEEIEKLKQYGVKTTT